MSAQLFRGLTTVLVIFGLQGQLALAEETKSNGAVVVAKTEEEVKYEKAYKTCYGTTEDKFDPTKEVPTKISEYVKRLGYSDPDACFLSVSGQRADVKNQNCDDISSRLNQAKTDFSNTCGQAGISMNCSSVADNCMGLMGSQERSEDDFKNAGFTAQSFANNCRTTTSDEAQRNKEEEQNKIQEELREARNEMTEAQRDMAESRDKILEAQKTRLESEQTARETIRSLATDLDSKLIQLNEEAVQAIFGKMREIEQAKLERAAAVYAMASIDSAKGVKLIEMNKVCKDRLKEARAEMRVQLQAERDRLGGRLKTRYAKDISKVTNDPRSKLRDVLADCMDEQNQLRAALIKQANDQKLEKKASIDAADNKVAMLEQEIQEIKSSLVSRIANAKNAAENGRQTLEERVNNAIAIHGATLTAETQNQQMYQDRYLAAEKKMNTASNSMPSLGNLLQGGLGGVMDIFNAVTQGGGNKQPASASGTNSSTIGEVINKKADVDRLETEYKNCVDAGSTSGSGGSSSSGSTVQ